MTLFLSVVDEGSFSAAARQRNVSPSTISKTIARLEARLGAQLIHRTTRGLRLSDEGAEFYKRARAIQADVEEAEQAIGRASALAGRIRVTASASYAVHVLFPALPRFLDAHPEVTMEFATTDRVVDLIGERADIAIRAGPLKSSGLISRGLGRSRRLIAGAPGYLEARGVPLSFQGLAGHDLLEFGYAREAGRWSQLEGMPAGVLSGNGRLVGSDGEALRQMALAGLGLARLVRFTVAGDLEAGRLTEVLGDRTAPDWEQFHAVWNGGGPMPARMRAFLDFLAEEGQVSDAGERAVDGG